MFLYRVWNQIKCQDVRVSQTNFLSSDVGLLKLIKYNREVYVPNTIHVSESQLMFLCLIVMLVKYMFNSLQHPQKKDVFESEASHKGKFKFERFSIMYVDEYWNKPNHSLNWSQRGNLWIFVLPEFDAVHRQRSAGGGREGAGGGEGPLHGWELPHYVPAPHHAGAPSMNPTKTQSQPPHCQCSLHECTLYPAAWWVC